MGKKLLWSHHASAKRIIIYSVFVASTVLVMLENESDRANHKFGEFKNNKKQKPHKHEPHTLHDS